MDTITDEKFRYRYKPKGYRKRRIPEKKQNKYLTSEQALNEEEEAKEAQ
jgi:hypothetical protein